MLGSYRLCLAVLVALSHTGLSIAGLNPGVIAVVGFYIVSGYVMTGLIRAHYARLDRIGAFYWDRVLRLYPHYLAIAGITLVWFAWTGARTDYLRDAPTLHDLLRNAVVVPLNFFMFNHADTFTLIPPAWSLGAEVQFYVVVPLVLVAGLRLPVMLGSLTIYGLAALGYINTDWYGYRLLPGVLWMFLVGSWLFDSHQRAARPRRDLVTWLWAAALVVAMAIVLAMHGTLSLPYNRETLIGFVIGLVAVDVLARRRRRPLDDMLGNLSYGVFLGHFLVMWSFFGGRVKGLADTILFFGIVLALAFTMFSLVERPMLKLRHKLRGGKARLSTQSSTGPAG